ncbi:Short-chain dehydrogenase/reductase ABA4 [Cladobotryum mycophilum]|uniref:Short-chain dehydrogenase/reductase ABA4 n=1 Tax=Cladobotryum mycophilum TaxID=491253 RepID=A0ABR0SBF1_9HYPO
MSFKGKVYAITGGASGIGLATAKLIHARGGTVCIADVNPQSLEAATAYFSQQQQQQQTSTNDVAAPFTVTKLDVRKREEVDAWIAGIVQQFGRLDGAANIAGVIGKYHGKLKMGEIEDDDWELIMGVNLTGLMYCMRAELRVIQDGGSIVNASSIHGLQATALHGPYGASKHGVVALTTSAAKEYGPRNIRVNAIAPGPIDTPLLQDYLEEVGYKPDAPPKFPTSIPRAGTPEEAAQVVLFLLGPDSTYVSGSVYKVDGASTES